MPAEPESIDTRDFKTDIGLMQTVYGIFLVLGFRLLADSFYVFMIGGALDKPKTDIVVPVSALGLVLTFLGLRFFWAVGNLRRYILRRGDDPAVKVRRVVTTVHFPLLIIHAFLFYCLCRLHGELSDPKLFDDKSRLFVYWYAGFLLFNSAWLFTLIRSQKDNEPEKTWIFNNASSATAALAIFFVLEWFNSPLTTSLPLVSLVFLYNSFVDLWRTAETYIWKSNVDQAPNKQPPSDGQSAK